MPGTLFVVATPIGNLEDVTLRALRILQEVDLIAAEDTRRTNQLLQHFKITTETTSFHRHNESKQLPRLLSKLDQGQNIALVTDAGTPTISDPGNALVAKAIQQKLPVEAIPGPSAILTALGLCGFLEDGFTFVGFPPSRSVDRKRWFLNLADEPRPLVLFESPHRIQKSLKEALNILGDRPIFVGRELTKMHEQRIHGTISEVIGKISNKKGEFTIIIDSAEPAIPPSTLPKGNALWEEFCQLTDNLDLSRRQLIAKLARRYGIQGRQMYEALEKSRRPTIQDQD